jgi:hypothetical protein
MVKMGDAQPADAFRWTRAEFDVSRSLYGHD